jgi:hypothetical protein
MIDKELKEGSRGLRTSSPELDDYAVDLEQELAHSQCGP